MKFLLTAINAKYIHSNPAIYSLKAYAGREMEEHISLAEFTINERTDEILESIYEQQPEVIAFSCYIWNMNQVEALLLELPKVLPKTEIWLGGPEVSFDAPQWLKKYPCLTGVMIGEGEETFRELLNCYLRREMEKNSEADFLNELSMVRGLCLPNGYTGRREPMDLSKLPFLYQDMKPFENRIIYYESSRGCPFSCSYCLSSIEKKVRLRDTSLVEQELQFFIDRKVPQVKFVDRTFNCNREHTRRIWTYLREHDNGITNFHFEIAADLLNEEEIALLGSLRPGLVQLEIGVQSTNPATIEEIHRVMDVRRLAGITEKIRKGHNVHQHLDLIVGLPYEDYLTFSRSFDEVYAMEPDQLQMGFLKLLKGSYMYEHREEYGIRYTSHAPYEVLYTSWITYPEVCRLKRIEEMVELYYNSRQYVHVLPFLISFFDGPFSFFERLADFYREEGYFIRTPARAYRYQVLLKFGEQLFAQSGKDCSEELLYLKELLLYDMYLRENLKSRPDLAVELSADDKEKVRSFYREEAEEREYLLGYEGLDARGLARQTHMEKFHYPVWESGQVTSAEKAGVPQRIEKGCFVLFDYHRRDALNYEAGTEILNL
ncbi:MAG: B12-binding domain-containing radical SAM protein [Eubacteriales bacterium]|nr:B12-binding domain-containing radical SAM protein [Eubacteriales bacterium]